MRCIIHFLYKFDQASITDRQTATNSVRSSFAIKKEKCKDLLWSKPHEPKVTYIVVGMVTSKIDRQVKSYILLGHLVSILSS